MNFDYEKDNLTKRPYEYYLKCYQEMQPHIISERLHIPYSEGENCFHVRFLGEFYKVTYPDFLITHETEENGIYPLENLIQAKILLLGLCFILWEGDEEFAPTAQILFSDNFPAAFSAEDVAYVGDIVMEYMKAIQREKR